MFHHRTKSACALFVLAILLISASPAKAQGFGMRAGGNVDPNQFYFGGHYEVGPLTERVWFRPNAEVGFGNDTTLIALNMEAAYRIPLQRKQIWTAYVGGGPALNFVKVAGVRETQAGLNALVGLSHFKGLFTEIKVGFLDSPNFKFGVGYSFTPAKPARKPAKPAKRIPSRRRR